MFKTKELWTNMTEKTTNEIAQRLSEMLTLQDSVNSVINSDWRAASNRWDRAIWTECAELIEHIGWKWWKKQNSDPRQIELELVDIFHFGLSELLQVGSPSDVLATCIDDYAKFARASEQKRLDRDVACSVVEQFALKILESKSFVLGDFCSLCSSLGFSERALYQQYVAKNVLNKFRQDHGYKTGSYIKMWHGREDNEWLSELVVTNDGDQSTFAISLYSRLEEIYKDIESV